MTTKQKVGIIATAPDEIQYLHNQLKEVKETSIAGLTFYEGLLDDHDVILGLCRLGKVNAAICAQILIDTFKVNCLINTGVAGAIDPRIQIGDIVISTDAVQHDFDVTTFNYEPGELGHTHMRFFKADDGLRKKAVEAAKEVEPCVQVYEGRICTGDQFISEKNKKDDLVSTYGGLCCEMEGAAIGHVSMVNHIPFVIIRVMSDTADSTENEDFDAFVEQCGECSAKITQHLISLLD